MSNPIQILIVEDEALFSSRIAMQLEQLAYQVIAEVDDSEGALKILSANRIDLILMDIHIQGRYDGVELAEMIHKEYQIPIIFITSNHDDLTFRRASRITPAAFITKPFSDIQLQRTIELSLVQVQKSVVEISQLQKEAEDEDVLFIKKRSRIHKVVKQDIFYLEADGKYTRVCTKSDFFLVRKPMKEIMELLVGFDFMQCHRSYVVNMKKVKSVDLEDDLLILEERTVPVSKREKDKLLERLKWI
ncbi:MAG: response regulator [Saprospiraceae bacterium]|nr:response regulator [Saprospiraceae bacterium]